MEKSSRRKDWPYWLFRTWAFLQSLVIVALVTGGLFATATALDRCEAWACGAAVFLFLTAWIVVYQKIMKG